MAKLLVDLRSALLLIGQASLQVAGREQRSIAEHEAILVAIRSGNTESAAQATAEHIRSIERDSLAEDGRIGSEPDARGRRRGTAPARRSRRAATR
jgi:DNA-binding GntR family transcriptional regulator